MSVRSWNRIKNLWLNETDVSMWLLKWFVHSSLDLLSLHVYHKRLQYGCLKCAEISWQTVWPLDVWSEQYNEVAPWCTWHNLSVCNCCADAERRKIKLKQSEKDAAAMSLMQRMRVIWSSDEDSLVSTDALPWCIFFLRLSFHCYCKWCRFLHAGCSNMSLIAKIEII